MDRKARLRRAFLFLSAHPPADEIFPYRVFTASMPENGLSALAVTILRIDHRS
jgi:hypothetical protein